jgi:hypothetical protein
VCVLSTDNFIGSTYLGVLYVVLMLTMFYGECWHICLKEVYSIYHLDCKLKELFISYCILPLHNCICKAAGNGMTKLIHIHCEHL